jgi:hypothetical protein
MKKQFLLTVTALLACAALSSFNSVTPAQGRMVVKNAKRQVNTEVYFGFVFDGSTEIRLYGNWINDAEVKGYITRIEYYDGYQFVPVHYLNSSATIYGETIDQPAVAKFNWKYTSDTEPLHFYNDAYNLPW